jgi:hypothetical protein
MDPNATEPAEAHGEWRIKVAEVLLALLIIAAMTFLGCAPLVPPTINLYDLSGTNLMRCDSFTRNSRGGNRGFLHCSSADSEKFQGEWVTMVHCVEKTKGSGFNSMPSANYDPLVSRWSWGASYGVDLENQSGNYGMFLLYGSQGTVIDGIFLFQGDRSGILGVATDNKGHRYKVMG